MKEENASKWCLLFKEGGNNLHDGEQSGREMFNWEISKDSPFSSDLSPGDYHLCLHRKKFLAGRRLTSD